MSCWRNITCPQQKQHTGTPVCQAKTHLLEPLNSTSLAAKGKDKLQKINDWYLDMYGKWNPSANHHFCRFQAFVFKDLSLALPWNCCFYKCWHLWLANVQGPSRTIFHHVLSCDAIYDSLLHTHWYLKKRVPLIHRWFLNSDHFLRSTLSYDFMTFHGIFLYRSSSWSSANFWWCHVISWWHPSNSPRKYIATKMWFGIIRNLPLVLPPVPHLQKPRTFEPGSDSQRDSPKHRGKTMETRHLWRKKRDDATKGYTLKHRSS